ncbi:hypothetical protein SLS55_007523 [Diplodia seriata]|uniref:Uncharacterized protein n=1 Tax=Diplodia seriata TaxID=420778 RepID=A0ABR3CCH2_9PEZI
MGATMLRRLSTTFKKDRKKDGAGPNGSSPKSSAGASPTHGHSELKPDTSTDREDLKGTFSQFAQVLHAARRPLPTQTGDGSYVKREDPASLFDNLKTFGIGDAKTLKDVLQNKAKKELIDDKTYLMERVIQVSSSLDPVDFHLTCHAVGGRPSWKLGFAGRPHKHVRR